MSLREPIAYDCWTRGSSAIMHCHSELSAARAFAEHMAREGEVGDGSVLTVHVRELRPAISPALPWQAFKVHVSSHTEWHMFAEPCEAYDVKPETGQP